MYSYHIFYFPFKWKLKSQEGKLFSEQTDLENIQESFTSNWLRNPGNMNQDEADNLYNEKNYFYEFVHPVLYDTGDKDTLIKHFERREPQEQDVFYRIAVEERVYELKVEAINLNFYTTGVGMLTFYLQNLREDQKNEKDILTINQYGRRIFPPFIADVANRYEIAKSISIEGLHGLPDCFTEDFSSYTHEMSWKPACFIESLITDVYEELIVKPIIDDRMFVNCWYANKGLSETYKKIDDNKFHEHLIADDFWYKFLFVDVNSITCKNAKMREEIVKKQTYQRWQKDGMLYGVSRYSFVFLSNEEGFHKGVLAVYMRTIYSRMMELILIQRASTLRFSEEVTRVSGLSKKMDVDKKIINQISSLYKEYIRFINKVHFREVTTQDQGIELYKLISDTLKTDEYIKDLDGEIQELYQYVSLLDDKIRNKHAEWLNIIAAIFLPATLCAGIFSMNENLFKDLGVPYRFVIIGGAIIAMCVFLRIIKRIKKL